MRTASSNATLGPSPWWLLLLAILPVISFVLHFRGKMVLGWDSEPALRPELALLSSLSAWNWHAYLGQPNVFQISQAPLAFVYWLLSIPFGVAGADKILLTALFVLPAFTMYCCVRRLFPRDGWLAFLAAWCYALCPLLFVRYYIPIMTVQLVYVLLPLLVNVWVDVVREGATARRLLWLAAVEVAFLPAANNLAYWLVPHLAAFLYVVLERWARRGVSVRGIATSVGRMLLVTALINAFWFFPVLLFGVITGPTIEREAITKTYTAGVRQDVAEGSSLSYSLRMASRIETGAADFYGPYWTYARSLENGLIAAPYFIWIFLAALAVALRPRDRRVIVLALLLCAAMFVMKGTAPPFAFVLNTLYQIPLLGTIFRNGNDKLLPMAAFSLSILVPIGLAMAVRALRGRWRWQPALLALVLAMAYPYWTGQMFLVRPGGPTLASMPPPDAFAFTRALDGLHSRVLFVPISDNAQLLATTWRFYGPNVYGSMTAAGFVAMPQSPLNVPGADTVTSSIHQAIFNDDVASFVALTRAAGIGYVYVAHDMDTSYYGGVTGSTIDSFLGQLPGTRVVSIVGNYTLWKLDWVGDVSHDLVRRAVVGYNTAFNSALALAPQCGDAPTVLVALAKHVHCQVLVSPPGSPDGRAELHPAVASVRNGRLVVTRRIASHPQTTTRLPAGTVAAEMESYTLQNDPTVLSLRPCTRYRVQTYLAGNGTSTSSEVPVHALPAPNAAYVSLPPVSPGSQLVTLHVTPDGAGATVSLSDSITGDTMLDAGKLRLDRSRLLYDAMPGRSYELALGANQLVLLPRAFVRGVTISSVRIGPELSMIAPPEHGTSCPRINNDGAVYQLFPSTVTTTMTLMDGHVVALPWDLPAGSATTAPLPRGTQLVRYGDEFVGTNANYEDLATGAPIVLGAYRAVGPTRTLALQNITTATDSTASNIDAVAGSAALSAPTANERWMRVDLPSSCRPVCVATVRISSMVGNYGVTITNETSTIVSKKEIRKPEMSLGFTPHGTEKYYLWVFTEPRIDASSSALQIASLTTTPVESIGTTTITLPRIRSAYPAEVDAIRVVGKIASAPPPLDGGRLPPSRTTSALVLDTQYDPFWTTLVFQPRAPYVYWPQHVLADAFKNAWLVGPGVSGNVVHFYLLDLLALIGAAIAALTILVLALGAIVKRGVARPVH